MRFDDDVKVSFMMLRIHHGMLLKNFYPSLIHPDNNPMCAFAKAGFVRYLSLEEFQFGINRVVISWATLLKVPEDKESDCLCIRRFGIIIELDDKSFVVPDVRLKSDDDEPLIISKLPNIVYYYNQESN